MLSLQEKAKCLSGDKDDVVTLLKDLFKHERYDDIVEAIELHVETQENKKSRRDSLHKDYVMPLIRNMIHAIGNKLFDFRQGDWEYFFKKNNKKNNEEEITWQDFILERLQRNYQGTGAFSSGIQAIKQNIIVYNKIRANNLQEERYEKPAGA